MQQLINRAIATLVCTLLSCYISAMQQTTPINISQESNSIIEQQTTDLTYLIDQIDTMAHIGQLDHLVISHYDTIITHDFFNKPTSQYNTGIEHVLHKIMSLISSNKHDLDIAVKLLKQLINEPSIPLNSWIIIKQHLSDNKYFCLHINILRFLNTIIATIEAKKTIVKLFHIKLFQAVNAKDPKRAVQYLQQLYAMTHAIEDVQDKNGNTPLHLAIINQMSIPTIVRILSAHPNCIISSNKHGHSPMHLVVNNQHLFQFFKEARLKI